MLLGLGGMTILYALCTVAFKYVEVRIITYNNVRQTNETTGTEIVENILRPN